MNTVEGALVMTALTAVAGALFAGLTTLSALGSAQHLARDGARAAALGQDAQAVIAARDPEARVEVVEGSAGTLQTVEVRVVVQAPVLDVSAHATTIAETIGVSE